MAHLEELLPAFRNGAKIRQSYRGKDYFIQLKDGQILNNYGSQYKFTSIDVLEDKWELYQEPIDWDYIIKNKCLCWFGVVGKEKQRIGIVSAIANFRDSRTYYIDKDTGFSACRPIRKDEVTFYEDKRDD